MSKAKETEKLCNDAKLSPSAKKDTIVLNAKTAEAGITPVVAGRSGFVRQEREKSTNEKQQVEKQSGSAEASSTETVPSKRKLGGESDAAQTSSKRRKKGKQASSSEQSPRPRIRRLAPPRPFLTVPTSVSATGPRSVHVEGKNRICITRKTDLGMYLRRCKDVVLKDGNKTLYLYAMGAAIPHLARLAVSLPSILPYAPSVIQTEIRTGTAEVQDEIVPENEEEDISSRKRGKSTMMITIKIEGGDDESTRPAAKKRTRHKGKGNQIGTPKATNSQKTRPEELVFSERDLDDDVSL